MVMFSELVQDIDSLEIDGDPDTQVKSFTVDSRQVETGDLFVAITGFADDGMRYIPDAVNRGATAIVAPEKVTAEVRCYAVATDIRDAIAKIAARFYGFPSRELKVIGITGTNGKTTVTHLLKTIIEQGNAKAGLLGTLGYFTGKEFHQPVNTTPGPELLEKLLREIKDSGGTHAVMEVSSHALSMRRVNEIDFDVVAISNITQDHFDFHHDFESYRLAKAQLLTLATDAGKWAVLNHNDPSYDFLKARVQSALMTFGVENPSADVNLSKPQMSVDGSRFTLETPIGRQDVHLKLLGRFNLENSLCAATCALALGIPLDQIAAGLAVQDYVAGRAQPVKAGQPFDVLVDYAHSPDALEKILQTAREVCRGRLLVLFGCGGDRDRSKRPLMGQAASANADVVIVTSDNPRSEDPLAIIEEIKPGLERSKETVIEPDRRRAIRAALDLCQDNDILVVAGKGHEDYQIIGNQRLRFDDKEIVEEILKERYA